MDQLQVDAAHSYDMSQMQRKRRDSFVEDTSEPLTSENAPLLGKKAATTSEVEDNGNSASSTRSIMTWAAKVGRWAKRKAVKFISWSRITVVLRATGYRGSDCWYDVEEMKETPSRVEYLMLGIAGDRGLQRLVQVRLTTTPMSDFAFFRQLQQEYLKNRARFYGINPFWRKVRRIHFVKFKTRQRTLTQQKIDVLDLESLPEPTQAGWTRSAAGGLPSPHEMVVYMKDPSTAQDAWQSIFFPQVPRKLDARIPEVPDEIGWGLLYIEGRRWLMINIIFVCVWIAVLAFCLTGLFSA